MIPEIVLRKIYWYEWKYKINQLNAEYHDKVRPLWSEERSNIKTSSIMFYKKDFPDTFLYNKRHLLNDSKYDTPIYTCRQYDENGYFKKVAKTPKNYEYSGLSSIAYRNSR